MPLEAVQGIVSQEKHEGAKSSKEGYHRNLPPVLCSVAPVPNNDTSLDRRYAQASCTGQAVRLASVDYRNSSYSILA